MRREPKACHIVARVIDFDVVNKSKMHGNSGNKSDLTLTFDVLAFWMHHTRKKHIAGRSGLSPKS